MTVSMSVVFLDDAVDTESEAVTVSVNVLLLPPDIPA